MGRMNTVLNQKGDPVQISQYHSDDLKYNIAIDNAAAALQDMGNDGETRVWEISGSVPFCWAIHLGNSQTLDVTSALGFVNDGTPIQISIPGTENGGAVGTRFHFYARINNQASAAVTGQVAIRELK